MNLRTPGPTPLPEPVRQALARDMVNHRGPEFAALMRETVQILKELFRTQHDLLILTGSGTGGLEAAAVNMLSPGDKVLAVSIGYFGDRFARIAEAFGAQVRRLSFPWGQAADPEQVRAALAEDPDLGVVLVTHNDTSTGVTNDLEALTRVVKGAGRLLLVDAVSSIGSVPLETDAWGCDVVITGSQKSWMTPPGLALVSVSPAAWEAHRRARTPRFYWDFTAHAKQVERGSTPWTPAVSAIYGLNVAVKLMQAEGLEAIFARHRRVADYARGRLRELGLRLLADERHASNTVTAFFAPEGVDQKRVLRRLREERDVVLAGGQGHLEATLMRIGHMGYVDVPAVKAALDALADVLAQERAAAPAVR
ncbi:MAG: alanine--glyoxylate aminotransferase family protein [Chloroflexi bacterium]|nr:alanine--glyoxylate aminotransferase family protein [Chloroflexota bacterium]